MKNLKRIFALCLILCVMVAASACSLLKQHVFSEDWKSDENNHWHVCVEDECEEKSDEAAHTYGEGVVTTPATEEAEGVMTYTCSVCGYEKNEAIEKLVHVHSINKVDEVAATCTEAGTAAYYVCSGCGVMFSDAEGVNVIEAPAVIDALGHDVAQHEAVEATCTEGGNKAYESCSRCDYTTYEAVDALGHDTASHEAQAATCTEIGWNAYETCSRCDYTTYAEIAALGHGILSHEAQAATCTEIGWNAYETCSRCDYTTYAEIAALGHNVAQHAAKDATCTEAGHNAYEACSRCDYTTYEEIAALGHGEIAHEAQTATCTQIGWNAYVTCSRCDYTTYAEIAILPHDTETVYEDATGHWDDCKNCDYLTDKVAHVRDSEGKCACGFECALQCEVCNGCLDENCALCQTKCLFIDTDKILTFAPNTEFGDAEGPDGKAPGSDGAYLTDRSIVAEHVILDDGHYATLFTLPNGTAAHTGVALRIDGNRYQAPGLAGFNAAIPMLANVATPLRMYFTNNGDSEITFKYSLIDYYYDKGAIELTLAAGESKVVILNALFSKDTVGLNHQIVFPNGAEAGASLSVRGEFLINGNFNGISVATEAKQLRFGVGETFSAEGLVLKAAGSNYDRVYISDGYTTNLDGYTFTADDIGTKTVFVGFAGYYTTYVITVDDHDHNVVFVPESAPVACVSDGVAAHYTCTVDSCNLYFGDAYGNEIIDAPATVSCHTAGNAATVPGTALTCGGCGATMGLMPMENWVYFTLTTQTSKIGSNIKNGKVEHADVEGMPGTKFYVGAGTIGATDDSEFYLKMSDNDAGYQTVIPNLGSNAPSGSLRTIVLFYKNYSDEPITMNLQNDASGGNGKITVPANGTAVCKFTVKNKSGSNWFHYYVDCNPQKDVVFGVYGYFYIHDGEVNAPTIAETPKTEYKVGESFTTEGLALNAVIPSSVSKTIYVTSGYTTNFDGYTFTAADVGTHTVTVTFAGKTVTYPITVVDDSDCENGNHDFGKISDEALFVEMQGNDAIYKYACVYCGIASEETYVADTIAFVPHHGSNSNYSLEYVTLDDGRIAVKLTFKTDVAAGTKFVISASQYPAGTNTAFPVSGNGRRVYMEMISNANANITWQPEFYGDRDGVTMDLVAGEAQSAVWVIKYDSSNNTASALPYQEIVVNSAVSAGTEVYITGAIYERGEVVDVAVKTAPSKIVYSVGDSFSSAGLSLSVTATDGLFGNLTIWNVTTDLDGKVFTAEDIGVHTVTVTWGEFTLTYDILVKE